MAQAASGFLRLMAPPTNPQVIGPAIADAITGHYAATDILATLVDCGQTGKGSQLDISMPEAMFHFNLDSFTQFYSVNEVMRPLSRPVVSRPYTFQCADGKWVAIHMSSPPKFWTGFLETTCQPHLVTDPRFAQRSEQIRHQNNLIALMTPIFRQKPRDHWCAALDAAEVPYAPAYDSDEATEYPQARHLGIKVSADHAPMGTITTVCAPYSFDGAPGTTVLPPPMLDQHGWKIRKDLTRIKAGFP